MKNNSSSNEDYLFFGIENEQRSSSSSAVVCPVIPPDTLDWFGSSATKKFNSFSTTNKKSNCDNQDSDNSIVFDFPTSDNSILYYSKKTPSLKENTFICSYLGCGRVFESSSLCKVHEKRCRKNPSSEALIMFGV